MTTRTFATKGTKINNYDNTIQNENEETYVIIKLNNDNNDQILCSLGSSTATAIT